ncbi:MAG: DUF748 domain-containing protein [Myxococcota bacterium]
MSEPEGERQAGKPSRARDRMRRLPRSRWFWVVLSVAVILIGVRIALPFVVERYVNDQLAALDGYDGEVQDVDLNLFRGAYVIEGIRIVKTDGEVPAPFFVSPRIDLSVQWKALLDGAIVAEIDIAQPEFNFVGGEADQSGLEGDWQDTITELVPIRINRFAVTDGSVHYRDFQSEPPVDIYVQNVDLEVTNLSNASDASEGLPAKVDGSALAMGSGKVKLEGDIDPLAKRPTFDLNLALRDLDITELNPFLEAYAKVDAEDGQVSMYTELAAKEGKVTGYVKPMIENLDILEWKEEDEGFFKKAWEGLVGAVAEVFENQPRDRIATRIPIRGSLDDPEMGLWGAIGSTLRNAFIQALFHGLEGSVGGAEGSLSRK